MDLVGRKLGLEGGGVVAEFLSQIAVLDPALIRAGHDLFSIRSNLAEALTVLADTTNWMIRRGAKDPRDALAGATPYLRMFSLVTAGWLLAKSALAAKGDLDAGRGDQDQLATKIITAKFFCEQILPQVHGLVSPVRAGHEDLLEIAPKDF